jgi:hypothetical protein
MHHKKYFTINFCTLNHKSTITVLEQQEFIIKKKQNRLGDYLKTPMELGPIEGNLPSLPRSMATLK